MMVQENQKAFQLKETHQLLIHAEKANLWGEYLIDLVILYYIALSCAVLQHNIMRVYYSWK